MPDATRMTPAGSMLHDGAIHDPTGCPRGRSDCAPLARYASPGFASYMCCGETATAPVPTDRLRYCMRSTHATGVDVLVNIDERDAVHTASVLLAGLSALGSVRITAENSERVALVVGTEPPRCARGCGALVTSPDAVCLACCVEDER